MAQVQFDDPGDSKEKMGRDRWFPQDYSLY